ncbi:hypothetical protein [Streptomyces sp. YGL11-2]|uniref:hypothetical protein n=1 Tax=Streptomyces sp. YGL11-2 TaxID=3414028 RepID=UPI003CF9560F
MTGLDVTADVLVVGGGPVGTLRGAEVGSGRREFVLAGKEYCGTSGATASGGTGVWQVPLDPTTRRPAGRRTTPNPPGANGTSLPGTSGHSRNS